MAGILDQIVAYESGQLLGRMGARSRDVNASTKQAENKASDEEVICFLNGIDDGFFGYRVRLANLEEQMRRIEIDFAAIERRVIQSLLDQGYEVTQVHDEIIATKPEGKQRLLIEKNLDFGPYLPEG